MDGSRSMMASSRASFASAEVATGAAASPSTRQNSTGIRHVPWRSRSHRRHSAHLVSDETAGLGPPLSWLVACVCAFPVWLEARTLDPSRLLSAAHVSFTVPVKELRSTP
jgi:hypothetical protein